MQDRPNVDELLTGIERFLKEQVAPKLENPLLFHTLVAANLLAIVRRELANEPEALERELAGLLELMPNAAVSEDDGVSKRVVALNHELCGLIRKGAADSNPMREKVLRHLAATLEDKMRISNPAMVEIAGNCY